MKKSSVTPERAAQSSASLKESDPSRGTEGAAVSRRSRNRTGDKHVAWALSAVTAVVLAVGFLAVQRFAGPGEAPVHEEPTTIQTALHTEPARHQPQVLAPKRVLR